MALIYTLLLYFAAAALLRRTDANLEWRYVIFFALVVTIVFCPILAGYLNFPVDFVQLLHPWRDTDDSPRTGNGHLNDVALQLVPFDQLVREEWLADRAPLWNNRAGLGYPLLANAQSGAFSPFFLPTLPLPNPGGFQASAILKILVALTFAFLFLRRRGFSPVASTIGSVAFSLSTFLTVWLHFPLTSAAAMIPVLWYCADGVLENPTAARFAALAIAFAATITSGQPELLAYILIALGCTLLFEFRFGEWKTQTRRLLLIGAAGILGAFIAAPFLLPFFEALPFSHRYQWTSEQGGAQILRLDPRFIRLFANPELFGLASFAQQFGPYEAEYVSGFAGSLALIAIPVALFAPVRFRRTIISFLVVAFLSLWIIMGWPVLSDLFHQLPGLKMSWHGRLRAIVCWALAIFAAGAVEVLDTKRKWILSAAAVLFGIWFFNFLTDTNYDGVDHRHHAISFGVFHLTAVALIALAPLVESRWPRGGAGLALAVTTAELAVFALLWNTPVPVRKYYPTTGAIARLQRPDVERAPMLTPYRIAGRGGTFFPNAAAMYGLEDIRAHDPMAGGRPLGFLRTFTGYKTTDYFAMLGNVDNETIDYLNVRYVMTSPGESLPPPRFRLIYNGTDARVYLNTLALPRFFAPKNVSVMFDDVERNAVLTAHRDWANTTIVKRLPMELVDRIRKELPLSTETPALVRTVAYSPREIVVEVTAETWRLITSSHPMWPGWRAYDAVGKEVKMIEVNGIFTGFLAPPGKSTIRLTYRPKSYYRGVALSLVTLAALTALVFFAQKRKRA